MTTSPVVPRDAFAVVPVVDYEPPTQEVRRDLPPCRPSSHAPPRRRTPHPPLRPCPTPPGRQPAPTNAGVAGVMSPPMRQAAIFADAALRRVLEVIDRRRPAAQLRPVLAPTLVDSVVSVGRSVTGSSPGRDGAAVLRRMRLQPAGRRDPETAAEVFGSYSRGNRMHAIACRVERVPAGAGSAGAGWQVVALHIG